MASDSHIADILCALTSHRFSISTFIVSIIQSGSFPSEIDLLREHLPTVLSACLAHPELCHDVTQWAGQIHTKKMVDSITSLTVPSSGWHFSAMSASSERLTSFRVEELAASMEDHAPELCLLLSSLLSPLTKKMLPYASGEPAGDEDEDELWAAVEGLTNEKELQKKDLRDPSQQHAAIIRIVCIAPFCT